jgi:hypothetical protein
LDVLKFFLNYNHRGFLTVGIEFHKFQTDKHNSLETIMPPEVVIQFTPEHELHVEPGNIEEDMDFNFQNDDQANYSSLKNVATFILTIKMRLGMIYSDSTDEIRRSFIHPMIDTIFPNP